MNLSRVSWRVSGWAGIRLDLAEKLDEPLVASIADATSDLERELRDTVHIGAGAAANGTSHCKLVAQTDPAGTDTAGTSVAKRLSDDAVSRLARQGVGCRAG